MHLHSCLSPCADDDMTPANMIGMASIIGLDVVALTDHNSCRNCGAFMKAADEYGILAIPGMELCTSEEVHVLCYFSCLEDALAFDEYVYAHMNKTPNVPEIFGNQLLYNEDDEICGTEAMLLHESVDFSFFDLEDIVPRFKGIYGPAHLDRTSNSLISNLGFIPPESHFKFAEFRSMEKGEPILEGSEYLQGCKIITDSDAHRLDSFNEAENFLHLKDKSITAVLDALTNRQL